MFKAKPAGRITGWTTLARMAFVGPVLMNMKKTAAKIIHHAQGNGT